MKTIKTPIIPTHQQFVKVKAPHELDKKAICAFAAIGFFLESDTYWKNLKVLPPGTINTIDEDGYWIDSKPWFEWHYTPRAISFEQAVSEFTELFHTICKEQADDKPVLLPLSGGLDSRTQAVAFANFKNKITSYSYSFKDGYSESGISREMARVYGYDFKEFIIQPGYLWDKIDELATLNECYSDFTNPRQMAVLEDLKRMEGIFTLGHGGDLFFDRGIPKGFNEQESFDRLVNTMIKKGGMELGSALWAVWELEGNFKDYVTERIRKIFDNIQIDNLSAKVRAAISSTWVPRWTSVNLTVFEAANPYYLPYFDNRMCEFICTIPEDYLADRKIQIAYIKNEAPDIAKITWQAQKPYNLYNYHKNRMPYNLPYRVVDKLKRMIQEKRGKLFTQRNWELQFLGHENDVKLQERLFDPGVDDFIPKELRMQFYNNFKTKDQVWYSHPLSMLLTLAVWHGSRKD